MLCNGFIYSCTNITLFQDLKKRTTLHLVLFIRFLQVVYAVKIQLNSLLFALKGRNICHCGYTLLHPILPLLTTLDQVRTSACPSVYPSSTSKLFTVSSTPYLYVDYTFSLSFQLSHNVATSSHPIISLLQILNLLPCKGLVKKSANIFSFDQCLLLLLFCFTLSITPKK